MTLTDHIIGKRTYELSNHLGNVLSTIADKPVPHDNSGDVDYFLADIRTSQDYSPFGVTLEGRSFTLAGAEKGRYGFQGQERDDEIKGEGNSYNYTYRMHDPRLGRFFKVDPLAGRYAHYSPYSFAGNRVIQFVELEGLEEGQPQITLVSPELKVQTLKETLIQRMEAAGIIMNYGFPEVVYSTTIKAHGQCDGDGVLKVKYSTAENYDGIITDDDWMAVIRHEYEHYVDDMSGRAPLTLLEGGIVANQTVVEEEKRFYLTADEISSMMYKKDYEEYAKENGEVAAKSLYPETDFSEEQVLSKWSYQPSNLQRTEINAYSEQLKGEEQGLYKLSDQFRMNLKSRLSHFERKLQWSIEYEEKNNLNADGSPKS